MKNPLVDKPWLLIVGAVLLMLGASITFLVLAQRNPPRFIEVPPAPRKP